MADGETKDATATAVAEANEARGKLAKTERQLAIERAARTEAESRGKRSAADAERYRKQAEDGQTSQVDTTVKSLETERDALIAKHTKHLADGEFEEASKVQFEMGEVATKLTFAKAQKANIETRAKGGGTDSADPAAQREQFIAAQTPASAAWLRDNPEYFTDLDLQERVRGAHSLAVGRKIEKDSAEYFEFIEEQAGIKGKGTTEERRETPQRRTSVPEAGKQRTSPGGAPPTRDGGTASRPANLRPGDRYIPPEMAEAARLCENTPEQYYDEYVRLVGDGKIADRFGILGR